LVNSHEVLRDTRERGARMIELTVGMATYQDFDGVYFSVQDLRLHHDLDNVEILVVDNFGCDTTAAFVASCGPDSQARYLRHTTKTGTAAPRQKLFEEARGQAVLCLDSHVLFAPGAIARLKQFYRDHPDTLDLYQGPILYDSLIKCATHFNPVWGAGMYGQWGSDPRAAGDEPFPIPMQGLGAFTCCKEAWLGFNPRFRGFGGEEFYIHEKFRQAGRQCWCLPWLRWLHRFGRPQGVAYPNTLEDRLWNYLVGWNELGLPLDSIYEHFLESLPGATVAQVASEALGKKVRVTVEEEKNLDSPYAPTADVLVDRILEVAQLTAEDVVYDLGCGDGRIVCAAAERYGCQAAGFDLDPRRLAECVQRKEKLATGARGRVTFKKQDLFEADLSDATVVFAYLLSDANRKLLPRLMNLEPGCRVILHDYGIDALIPDEGYPLLITLENDRIHRIYRYTAPLKARDDSSSALHVANDDTGTRLAFSGEGADRRSQGNAA
jgi:SAM-dependent methyltransferase